MGNIIQPPVGIDIKMNFANVGLGNVTYPPYTFKWNSTEGAALYDADANSALHRALLG